jgi:hypothetical protein
MQINEWLVNHKREIVLFALFFLISTISFGLGYLVANQTNHAPIIIEKSSSN